MTSFNTRPVKHGSQTHTPTQTHAFVSESSQAPAEAGPTPDMAANTQADPAAETPAPAHLRLRRPEEDEPRDSIPFERRTATRRPISGHVTAVRYEKRDDGMHNRICSLTLVDTSDFGIGAFCQDVVPVGTTITVFFPPHGPDRGFDVYGKVLRCDAENGRYRIGIQLIGRAAA